uniref:Uncharacterized protein n=1 Tax=Arundo donax TaxID=35708 RepID=A0A0A9F3R8_ARUDO
MMESGRQFIPATTSRASSMNPARARMSTMHP